MKPGYKGFEKVDAYLIPYAEVKQYKRRRNAARKAVKQAMYTFCKTVYTDFHGDQDGEAVIGLDDKGESIAFIHLDPYNLDLIEEAQRDGRLIKLLQEV